MLSETKCSESFSNDFSKSDGYFLLKPFINCTYAIKVCSIRKKSISVGYLLFGSHLNIQKSGWTVDKATLNCLQNTRMQYLVISFIGDIYLKYLRTLVGCEF